MKNSKDIKQPSTQTIILSVKKAHQNRKGIKSEKDLTQADHKEINQRASELKHKNGHKNAAKDDLVIDLTPYFTEDELTQKKNPPGFVKSKKDEKLWRKVKRIVKEEYAGGRDYSKFTPFNWRQVAGIFWNVKKGLPIESNPVKSYGVDPKNVAIGDTLVIDFEETEDDEREEYRYPVVGIDHKKKFVLIRAPGNENREVPFDYLSDFKLVKHNPNSVEQRIEILNSILSQPLSKENEEYFTKELEKLKLKKQSNPVELIFEEVE